MDKFNVLLPHLTVLIFLLLYFGSAMIWVIFSVLITFKIFNRKGNRFSYVWNMTSAAWEKIIFSLISVVAVIFIIFIFVPWLFNSSLENKPDKNWQEKVKNTNTAIIFGFGYGRDTKGKITPEATNQFLYELSKKQMNTKYLIAQEGVYIAAWEDSISLRNNNTLLIRMHPHNLKKDINTYEAAKYALTQMEKFGQIKAVVYASNLQQKRAIADLKQIANTNPKWQNFTFISPDIPNTPFPKHSAQWRTRYKFNYRAIELYYSRVRDTWCYY